MRLFSLFVLPLYAVSFMVEFTPLSPVTQQPGSLPLCANCLEAVVTTSAALTCRLFGKTDAVWGGVEYAMCTTTRRNESLCGADARYYVRATPFIDRP